MKNDLNHIRAELEHALEDPSSWNTECYVWAVYNGHALIDEVEELRRTAPSAEFWDTY